MCLLDVVDCMGVEGVAGGRSGVQVLEVWLGGRLDATNGLDAGVCVITSISLDHMAILGNTIGEIAADKAGIIKPGSTVVIAPQASEALAPILAACQEKEAAPILVGRDVTWEEGWTGTDGQRVKVRGRNGEYELYMPLLGAHQLENAVSAVAAVEALGSAGIEVSAKAMGMMTMASQRSINVLSMSADMQMTVISEQNAVTAGKIITVSAPAMLP